MLDDADTVTEYHHINGTFKTLNCVVQKYSNKNELQAQIEYSA